MLVLSRKVGEKLVLNDNTVISINRISGNRVTIGIEAPHHVRVVRGELDRFPITDPEPLPDPVSSTAEINAAVLNNR
jgi:carbon storage regulator CsrA